MEICRFAHQFRAGPIIEPKSSNPVHPQLSRSILPLRVVASDSVAMANNPVRVAAAQMTSVNDLSTNFSTCSRLVKDAVSAGAKLLCFPENFSFVGDLSGDSVKVAEPLDGPIIKGYCSLARDSGIWLSLGGFQEKGSDDAHLRNAHVLIDDCGNIRSVYRKMHIGPNMGVNVFFRGFLKSQPKVELSCVNFGGLVSDYGFLECSRFDVDVPGSAVYKESSFTEPGNEIVAVDSPFGRLGLTVCYDLRFPELYQQLRFHHNCQVLLVPAAFTKPTGRAHWEILLRARAIETQCYVIAAAQAGKHNDKRESYGESLIIDPWGSVVGRLPDRLSTGIAVADIDFSAVDAIRTKMPISQHRKPIDFWKSASH